MKILKCETIKWDQKQTHRFEYLHAGELFNINKWDLQFMLSNSIFILTTFNQSLPKVC